MYPYFLMFHACLVSTLLYFVYTLRYFYTFFGTNLLTRCHGANCLFSVVFGFRKASKEIFSELDRTKAKVNISPRRTQRPKGDRRRTTGWPHPPTCRPTLGRAWAGRGPPGRPPASPLHLYNPPDAKTLSTRSDLHEIVRSLRHHRP